MCLNATLPPIFAFFCHQRPHIWHISSTVPFGYSNLNGIINKKEIQLIIDRYDSEHWWLKEDNVPVTVSAGGFVTEVQALTPFVENRDPNNMNEYLQVRFGINVQDYIYIFTPVSAELFQSQIGCLKK